MPILNYTTSIDVEKTQGEVIRALTRRGVTRISTLFQDGQPAGLGFTMETQYGIREFELPIRVDGVSAALARSASSGEFAKLGVRPAQSRVYLTREHAARVAWRIAKDWLDAQAALVDADLVTLDEVMFPLMVAGGHGETTWQLYQNNQKAIGQR